MSSNALTIVCSSCQIEKPDSCFYKHISIKPDGIRKKCNDCRKLYRSSAHSKNPEVIRNQKKLWAEKNKYKIAIWQKEHRKKHPEWHKGYQLKKSFGITYDDFKRMLHEQNGVCAICDKPEKAVDKRTGKIKDLAVDHCKITGKIRRLLCWTCNTGIGKLQHSPSLLIKAAKYLEENK